MVEITITAERADSADATMLIDELDAILLPMYPLENHHGYTVEQLIQQGVALFVTRVDGVPAGCGGIQFYDGEYGELKRMYVRPQFRGLGLAKRMIAHLSEYALGQGYHVLRLETGDLQHEAIGLYEREGFTRIPVFGDYIGKPISLYYEKRI